MPGKVLAVERLEVDRDSRVTVRLEVSGAPRCTARFVTDQGVLFTSDVLPVAGSGVVEWRTRPRKAQGRLQVLGELEPDPRLGQAVI